MQGCWYYFLIILSIFHIATAKNVTYTFLLQFINITRAPDGVAVEHVIGINGEFPGPTIHAYVGDLLKIDVVNLLELYGRREEVTVHWHGLNQLHSQFEDGISQVSQCPLPFGHIQHYEFKVLQQGTYWWV
jgi:FtsP/CotA-like multicopper oxidase with cupredoxin domain